ncbi:MAG: TadE/TadG family type IV pilus assembly protein [Anaerolineales bacterium]
MRTLPTPKMTHPTLSPSARRERGQSLVEFSLMGVFLTVLLVGVLDLGRAYFTYLALKDAASEGSFFGSVYPACISTTDPACAAPNNVDYRIRNSAPSGGLVSWTAADIQVDAPTPTPGEAITVTVTYQYPIITPFIGAIVGGQTIQLSARSVAVISSNGTP